MKRLIAGVLAVLALGSAAPGAQELDRLFKAAMNAELVDGDLRHAIEQYKQVAASANRALAAQALVRMAECHQKLGDAEAQKIYERVVRDYSDQTESTAVARARLGFKPDSTAAGLTLRALPRSDVLPGTISQDGRFLSFTNWKNDGHLYVRDLRTGAERALTQRKDFNIGLSSISRDATLVAFQTYGGSCDGQEGGRPALCLVSTSENGVQTPKLVFESEDVIEVAPMSWSPDGRSIAVTLRREDRTAQVGLVNIADGSLRVLQSVEWRGPTRIVFSPDGKNLAFDLPVSDSSDDRHIAIRAVDGSSGLSAIEHPSQNIVMGWTADGSQLLFASDRGGTMGLWTQPFAERRPKGLASLIRGDFGGIWSMGVTRDGSLYFGVRKNERDISLTTLDLETGKQTTSPARPIRRFVGTNLMPEWSSDGRHLAYVSQRGFDPTNNNGRIIGIHDITTGEERELRPRLLYLGPLAWSPDGATLLTAGTDVKGRSGVFSVNARTGDASLLVAGTIGAHPQWSPDGKRVFYRSLSGTPSTPSAVSNLVERELASGAERTIVSGGFAVFSVSPDGRSIALPLGANQGPGAIVQIRVDTGEMQDLLRPSQGERLAPYVAPQWTPDGRAVLVHMRTPNELWLVPTTGAPARKLDLDVRDWSFGPIGQFSVHPDGRRIAFLSGNISNEVMVFENFLPASQVTR